MATTIAKPDTHTRDYAYVELPNKLRAIVASDPKSDKAGAALTVNVGMCYERKDLPGLAHFLEHMLFTGTEKYPTEGEYREFIKQNGGTCNANTACYVTNFYFDVKKDALEPALDRFSRFFTEPLLTRDCTDREINAVDSEFQAGHTMPWWRYIGIMHQSANPNHPFHVAVGNNKMLKDDPKEKGVDLYEEMLKFYHEFYSSNGMTVCVIGQESLEELEAMVQDKFSAIVNKGISLPLGDTVSNEPPFLPGDWNRLLLQAPVKDVKQLTFSWVLPWQGNSWRSKPTSYVSHLLGHEGKGSLTAVLKGRGLISACVASNGSWLEGAFSLLHICFDLTDKGLFEVQQIGTLLFTYLGLLQKSRFKDWIFLEMQRLRQIMFQFQNDRQPFALASQIAGALQRLTPSEALAGSTLLYEADPDATMAILALLEVNGVRVMHQAKVLADRCTERDSSYDSPMKFEQLDPAWVAAWSDAVGTCDSTEEQVVAAAAAHGIHLPEPNPFVPEDLSLREPPAEPVPLPVRLQENRQPPINYVFHRQDTVFMQPKSFATFFIRSPFICQDAASYVKVDLWSRIVEEALAEYSYDAEIAGANYSLGVSFGGLLLIFAGFHDKLDVLIKAVTKKMRSLSPVPENLYQIVMDAYGDQLRNAAFHSRPISQCSMRVSDLLNRGIGFPIEQSYKAFGEITRESLDCVFENVFRECHVEAMVLGNTTIQDADSIAGILVESLALDRALAALPTQAEAALPPGKTVWSLDSTDKDDPNNAVLMRVQLRRGIREEALLSVLCKVLNAKFFDSLRTQQQLGYIVAMGATVGMSFSYVVAQVQTEYPVDFVKSRIDDFFEKHFAWIQDTLSEEEVQTCVAGVLAELRTRPKNLHEEHSRYSRAFLHRTYDFKHRSNLIEFLEAGMSLEVLRSFVSDDVVPAPRLYVQVKKVLEKEDKPLPQDAAAEMQPDTPDLRKWNGLTDAAAAEFAQGTEWAAISALID